MWEAAALPGRLRWYRWWPGWQSWHPLWVSAVCGSRHNSVDSILLDGPACSHSPVESPRPAHTRTQQCEHKQNLVIGYKKHWHSIIKHTKTESGESIISSVLWDWSYWTQCTMELTEEDSGTDRHMDRPLTSRTRSRWPGTSFGKNRWSLPLNPAVPAWNGPGGTGVPVGGKPGRSPPWWPLGWRRGHRSRPRCRNTGPLPALWPSGGKTGTGLEPWPATKASGSAGILEKHHHHCDTAPCAKTCPACYRCRSGALAVVSHVAYVIKMHRIKARLWTYTRVYFILMNTKTIID